MGLRIFHIDSDKLMYSFSNFSFHLLIYMCTGTCICLMALLSLMTIDRCLKNDVCTFMSQHIHVGNYMSLLVHTYMIVLNSSRVPTSI